MRRLPLFLSLLCLASPSAAGEKLRIGVSAPLTGPYAVLGRQIMDGANAARLSLPGGETIELVIEDDECTAEGAKRAAQSLIEQRVHSVLGYLCSGALNAALPALRERSLPVLTIGARTPGVTQEARKNGDALFRIAPDSGQEAAAITELLLALWRDKNFAIIDDGTIHARELAEALRLAAEASSLKPAFTDTYRPALENQFALISRLKKAGATHVFVGGDRDDIAILARDAKLKGYALTIAGGEALGAAPGEVPMEDGVLMVGVPEIPSLEAATKALGGANPENGLAEGYFLPAFAAVEIIAKSIRGMGGGTAASGALANVIRKTPHATVLGTVRFGDNGDLLDNPYRLFVSHAGRFESFK
jgi:branched-chain amino acid transport system substrate-binding protein